MAEVHPRVEQAMQYFQDQGYSKEQSAGIVGNLMTESYQSLNPAAFNSAGGGRGAMGIAQWRGPRITAFEERYGKTQVEASFEEQLDFINYELNTTEKRAKNAILAADTPSEAALAFEEHYERSGGSNVSSRMQNAQKAYSATGTTGTPQVQSSAGQEVAENTPSNPINQPRSDDDAGSTGQASGSAVENTSSGSGGTSNNNGQNTANNDDAASPGNNGSSQTSQAPGGKPEIAAGFTAEISPKENPLKLMATMNYTLSWYMMSVGEFNSFLSASKKSLNPQQLIMQTSGTKVGQRNPFFDLDFYIDDLELENIIGTQESGSPLQVGKLRFKVLEPQGITLLDRLTQAVKAHNGDNVTPVDQNYVMVIRFYGFDKLGNPITAADLGNSNTTDPNAAVEKYIPFRLATLGYKIGAQATEYQMTGIQIDTNVTFSQSKQTIPFNVQLVAKDVKGLLTGEGGGAVTQGLTQVLNDHQAYLVEKGVIEIPDEYVIEIENAAGLSDAKLMKAGRPDKKIAHTLPEPYYDKETRSFNVVAGTQITDLIDLVLRSSTFVTEQQYVGFDEKTGELIQQGGAPTTMWYRIRGKAEPIKWDNKRNEYAHKIKYKIMRYQINNPLVKEFPPSKYRGVHKLYDWVFTGLNTEVLDFEINVNAQFYLTNPGEPTSDPMASVRGSKFPIKKRYGQFAASSQQGGYRGSSYAASNLSERLYSIADVAQANVRIVGDPDWIPQAVLYYEQAELGPWLSTGGINSEAMETLFEMRFNRPADYNLGDGVTHVNDRPPEELVYAAHIVNSYFREGTFEQSLYGTIRQFADFQSAPAPAVAAATRGAGQPMPDLSEQAPKSLATSSSPGLKPGVKPMKVATTEGSAAAGSMPAGATLNGTKVFSAGDVGKINPTAIGTLNGPPTGTKVFSANDVGKINPTPVRGSTVNSSGFVQSRDDDSPP